MPASRSVTRAVSDVLEMAPRRGEVTLQRLLTAVSESRGRPIELAGADLPPGGRNLSRAASVDLSGLHRRLADVEIVLACNPSNVLCGEEGVAPVFARQKGATDEDVEVLSRALENWATILERDG